MDKALELAALCAASFSIGSIPFGVLVGRIFFHSDIRSSGSGNIGAANALRTYGKGGAVAVLLLDSLKGFVPTFFAWHAFGSTFGAAIAVCAVLGHVFSPWLKFRGGKGVATLLGVLFAMSWVAGLAFIAVWIAVVAPTRFASLGSLIGSALSPLVVFFVTRYENLAFAALAIAAVVFWAHRENIERLLRGRENKLA